MYRLVFAFLLTGCVTTSTPQTSKKDTCSNAPSASARKKLLSFVRRASTS
jgi:starvation-inducible outer membrane lipoprotein